MYRDGRVRRAGVVGALLALACWLSGCNLLGASNGQAASTHATATMTGTWTYKTQTTDERLHLKQDRSGALSGDGTSAVTVSGGHVDHTSIMVHDGKVRGRAVSLTLYVTQIDWGSGLTAVEYLNCDLSGQTVSCRMNLPLFHIKNALQTFHKAAVTMTGTWTYKTQTTDERLHLKQDHSGTLSGDGTSAVAAGGGQVDHSSISVHTGKVKGSAVSLTLFVTQDDWGSGLTAVEYLSCSLSGQTLNCHMNLPLFHVKNAPQTFHKA